MATKDRILQFIEYKGISKRKFCEKSLLSHTIFNNNSAIGSDKLEKIYTAFPELNIDWIVTGRGEMLLTEGFTQLEIENTWDNLKTIHYGQTFKGLMFDKPVKEEHKYLFEKNQFTLEEYGIVRTLYNIDFYDIGKNISAPGAKVGLVRGELTPELKQQVEDSVQRFLDKKASDSKKTNSMENDGDNVQLNLAAEEQADYKIESKNK